MHESELLVFLLAFVLTICNAHSERNLDVRNLATVTNGQHVEKVDWSREPTAEVRRKRKRAKWRLE